MYDEKIETALRAFPSEISDDFPRSLPLLDDFRQAYPRENDALANVNVLLIQHHLGHFLLRLKALFEEGLRPENTWLIDIPYSTNEQVRKEVSQRFGIPDLQIAPPFRDPIAPYLSVQQRRVIDMIEHLSKRMSRSRLLVIDSGAQFIQALERIESSELGFIDAFRGRTAIVEQTTRGHRCLQKPEYRKFVEDALDSPVVSIARCSTKTEIEIPFLGMAASKMLVKLLEKEGVNLSDLGEMAIIGFGPVGQAVFRAIRKDRIDGPILVADIDQTKHQRIAELGGEPRIALPKERNFDLVVGCTGKRSFGFHDWDCLSNNAYLASASSATVEFNRRQFIDLAERYPDDEIEIEDKERVRKDGFHTKLTIRNGEKRATFLNTSFPVDFDGRMENLPTRMIQPTHALLYAAGFQAIESNRPGMTPIDIGIDKEIKSRALEYV